MEGEAGEFQDWEVLHNSESDLVNSSESSEKLNELEYLEGDSEGIIRSDYFSLDYERTASRVNLSEESSVDSDNPSWVDPDSETPFERKNLAEFWSDSGSDRSFQHKISEIDAKNELGFVENAKIEVGFEGIDKIQTHSEDSGKCWSDSGKDNGTDGSIMDSGGGNGDSKGCLEGERHEVSEETESGYDDVAIQEVKSRGEEEKRKVVWWRIPLELLKFCVFKASPAWSFSLAAAVVGFVILGRRLYKMKRKSQGLQLKVTVDDKKVSQFMSRAARLNEAFSVVRRVPIIRPSLPAGGVTPWPVMSLR